MVHWFHRLQDGAPGLRPRTHASDNLLWLAWARGRVRRPPPATTRCWTSGRPTCEAEQPFEPLPGRKAGMGFDPLRSSRRADTVYRHCMKAIDLVLEHRMGAHGLPLDRHRRLERRPGRDRQPRPRRKRLARFLSLLTSSSGWTRIVARKDGPARQAVLCPARQGNSKRPCELTWRGDRYLRAIHDDGTEIGVKGSGVWEIDALTAAWAVMSGHQSRSAGRIVLDTALGILGTRQHHPARLAAAARGQQAAISAAAVAIPRGCAKTACTATACNGWSAPRGSWPSSASGRARPEMARALS